MARARRARALGLALRARGADAVAAVLMVAPRPPDPGFRSIIELIRRLAHFSLNLAWVLVGGFLVMFMQVGFAMLETGFTRSKNAVNTMAMNLIIYPIGIIGFWLTGYALMMGGVAQWPSLGATGIGQSRVEPITSAGIASASSAPASSRCSASATTRRASRCSCSRWSSWTPRPRFRPARWRSAGSSRRSSSTACSCRCSSTRCTATGSGAADGSRRWG